jgi:hypothetical protein
MWRERVLKLVLVLVGSLFTAGIYPVTMILWQRDQSGYTDAMMHSLYVTLGILLLIAVRNPSGHRSLIAFASWSSFAHARLWRSWHCGMRASATSSGSGDPRCDWRTADRAGSGEASGRAGGSIGINGEALNQTGYN